MAPAEVLEGYQRWEKGQMGCSSEAIACFSFDHVDSGRVIDLSGSRNDLSLPALIFFKKPILHLPPLARVSIDDIILNLGGFLPAGFLFSVWFSQIGKRRHWLAATLGVLAGTLLSVTVEIIQAWLPSRDSSMADVIANAAGSLVGAISFILLDKSRFAGKAMLMPS